MAHWCVQEGKRCEAIGPLPAFPLFSLSLFLSSSACRKGHWGWTNKSHGHQTLLTTAALGLHSDSVYWSLQCAYSCFKKTHACTQTHTPPSLPINMTVVLQVPTVRSLIPQVALEQHQQYKHREKGGERRTIQLLNCSAVQEELSIKLIKNGRESRNWFVKGSWCQLHLKLWAI